MKVRRIAAEAKVGGARDRVGWRRAGAYAIAAVTHLLTAGLLAGGLSLVVLGWETVVQPLIGLLLLGFAALLHPRVSRLDPGLPTLRRADAPALFGLLDDIADTAGAGRLHVVQVSPGFAVRAFAYGIRRRRGLEIGLPLWLTLAPQERVAAVAHEVGHFVSGDDRRGFVVSSALGALSESAEREDGRLSSVEPLFTARSPLSRHADEMAEAARRYDVGSRAADGMLWLPKWVGRSAARLLVRLTLPGARRAEFRADAVAARVASTEAAVSALRARELAGPVSAEVQRRAVALRTFREPGVAGRADERFWAGVAVLAAELRDGAAPSDGRRDGAGQEGSGLPSSDARVARMTLGAALSAAVTLDDATAEAIEAELREPRSSLARTVVQDCVHA
ncbi:M48 family metallopeptidase [Streptomyces sp. RKND-216]|uniref:M48 family metallopeptidase n=1 Tax=Streptomyces sp. RKND-216 TaxID=2562581 RepID=UPI001B34B280|nr:M48 family metallopeptidase [Streptomyces sp. RKND-216]